VPQGYPQSSLRIVDRDKQWDHRSMSTRFLTIADVSEPLQLPDQGVRRTGKGNTRCSIEKRRLIDLSPWRCFIK